MGLEFSTFETKRLLLRPITTRDNHAFLRIFSDLETMKYWSREPLEGLDEAEKMVREEIEWGASGKCLNWGVTRRKDDELIGKISLFDYDKQHHRMEIGFVLDRACWNQGFTTEAVEPVIRYAFEKLGLHRIEADVDPGNTASLALLERFGFRREGLSRDRYKVHGRWHDSVILGLLELDYRGTLNGAGG